MNLKTNSLDIKVLSTFFYQFVTDVKFVHEIAFFRNLWVRLSCYGHGDGIPLTAYLLSCAIALHLALSTRFDAAVPSIVEGIFILVFVLIAINESHMIGKRGRCWIKLHVLRYFGYK